MSYITDKIRATKAGIIKCMEDALVSCGFEYMKENGWFIFNEPNPLGLSMRGLIAKNEDSFAVTVMYKATGIQDWQSVEEVFTYENFQDDTSVDYFEHLAEVIIDQVFADIS